MSATAYPRTYSVYYFALKGKREMYKFDTQVQHLKYKVLRTVARHAWNGDFYKSALDIPKEIIPGKIPTKRCCVYKERAILAERVKLAAGGDRSDPNVIQAIDIACDDCPTEGYTVTEVCRGCLAHRCEDACPRGAITHDENHHAHIDKSKCINCGKCAKVCPYGAIINRERPCKMACKVGAIQMNEDGTVRIDDSRCTSCGACVYRCPFGAVSDKSFILDVINLLKSDYHVYALPAPSIAGQFTYAKPGQVMAGIKQLGFYKVVEVALGADIVAASEGAELAEKGFLTSSCCPAFVSYVKNEFPSLTANISSNPSPMVAISKFIKEKDPEAKTVFIGPCIAKKREALLPGAREYVDCVMTFEELQALFDSRDIDITTLPNDELGDASGFGRAFARSGGLAEAAAEAIAEQKLDFEAKPIVCSGFDECRLALLKASKGKLDFNFIEGMACVGGCVNGAGCLTHNPNGQALVNAHGKQAQHRTISEALENAESVVSEENE